MSNQFFSESPAWYESDLPKIIQELAKPISCNNIPYRIQLCKFALAVVSRKEKTRWAALNFELGKNLAQNPIGDRANNIEQAIRHYNLALEVYNREKFPKNWAEIQNDLGNAYCDRCLGNKADNVEKAIGYYNQSMEVFTIDASPVNWAMVQNNLATAYIDRIQGAVSENMKQAVIHCNQALSVYNQSAFPKEWAGVQNNLANAYRKCTQADRAENIEKAIYYYNLAFNVYTKETYSEHWTMTHNNISSSYINRIRGDRSDNIERAIQHCELALETLTKEAVPIEWAKSQKNLAIAYSKRIQGNRTNNTERAFYHYNLALNVYTKEGSPFDWANIQCGLGIAYRDLAFGDRARNIEAAIDHFNKASEIFTKEAHRSEWAKIQNELGQAYNKRISGDRTDNIEKAIFQYNDSLIVLTKENYPFDWAMVKNNLAGAYLSRILGNRSENIEIAINYFDEALEVYAKNAFPEGWANIQNNLANSYTERISGDRADNIEKAILHYNQALLVFAKDIFPEQWAVTQNNLSKAYGLRIFGDNADNKEKAIHYCNEALKVHTRENFPEQWAVVQNNLGEAYKKRLQGSRSENIEQSIEYYNHATEIHTQELFPIEWAMIQNNLATAYMDRVSEDRGNNIEQAIHYYNQALQVFTRKAFPFDWASLQNNMGNACHERKLGDSSRNIKCAIYCYEQSLGILHPDLFPNDCRRTAHRLGDLYFDMLRWEDAVDAYQLAIKAAERLYQSSLFRNSREIELAEAGDLYRRAAYALAKLDRMTDAVVILEKGRARGLSESLIRDRADLERVRAEDPESFEFYQKSIALLRQLELEETSMGQVSAERALKYESLRETALRTYEQLSQAIGRIRRIPGNEDFLSEPNFSNVIDAVTGSMPLVYLLTTPDGGLELCAYCFVDDSGSKKVIVEKVWIEGFTEGYLRGQLNDWFENYRNWLRTLNTPSISVDEMLKARKGWFDALEKVTEDLWKKMMEKVVRHIRSLGFEGAFLVSTGLLSLLPLYASWWIMDGQRHYALDEISFAFAPSARTLAQAKRIAASTQANKLLAIDEPRPVKASPLPNSHKEVTAVKCFFKETVVLEHEKAKRNDLLQMLPKAEVAHFSCHGSVDWIDPSKSCLLMANDETLTIKDLFGMKLKGARMATLSACETGVIGTHLPDEVVSLPSAFMKAGFAGVVASLWTVPDLSTSMLMESFYSFWKKEGLTPVQALREAQMQLREVNGFEHPFYWAAFYLTGL